MYEEIKIARILNRSDLPHPEIFREAFTHKTFAMEHNLKYDNQRLEFLGDAVVQIIISQYLYAQFPEADEGVLTRLRAILVDEKAHALYARRLNLGDFIMLGHGEKEIGGNQRESTLSDLFESFIAAIYLNFGLETATDFFLEQMRQTFPDPMATLLKANPKGELQEYVQQKHLPLPVYKVVSVSGPDHDPTFKVELSILGYEDVTAEAGSRKGAENVAAEQMLKQITERKENEK